MRAETPPGNPDSGLKFEGADSRYSVAVCIAVDGARSSKEVGAWRACGGPLVDRGGSGAQVVDPTGLINEQRICRDVAGYACLIGNTIVVLAVSEDQIVLPSRVRRTVPKHDFQPDIIAYDDIISENLLDRRYPSIDMDPAPIGHDGVVDHLRPTTFRKRHVKGAAGIVCEDVVRDGWRRVVDKRNHA